MKEYLTSEVKKFIRDHLNDDVKVLALKKWSMEGVPYKWVLEQILGRQKGRKKLSDWIDLEDVIMPPQLSYEQCSSMSTASYKSSLIQENDRILDMTGGFGVDDAAFSDVASNVVYCERNKDLADVAMHNFRVLGKGNIDVISGDSVGFLNSQLTHSFDVIYLDPARRGEGNKKVIGFSDCEPNPIDIIGQAQQVAKRMLVKASPMIDIALGCEQLGHVDHVHVLAIDGELKEVLFDVNLQSAQVTDAQIHAVNITKGTPQSFKFDIKFEQSANVEYSAPLRYVYEPNAALLKSGCFKSLALEYRLKKFAPHSHLYTSDELVEFPGRRFEVIRLLSSNKKEISTCIPSGKANITTRNFPMAVDQLRKKLRLKDGGEDYILASTLANKKTVILHCRRITA